MSRFFTMSIHFLCSSFRNFECLIHETFLQDFSIHFKIKSVKKINIPRRIPKIFHDNL